LPSRDIVLGNVYQKKRNLNGEDHLVLFRSYRGNPEMPSFLQSIYIYVINLNMAAKASKNG
jgi:hypothetical protein